MKHSLFIIILLSLFSCNQSADKPPVDLIPQDKMISLFVDIHVADAMVEHKFGTQNPNLALSNALYERIYHNHGVSAAQYKSSYKYYEVHPDLMDKMYTQVITELSKEEALMGKAK